LSRESWDFGVRIADFGKKKKKKKKKSPATKALKHKRENTKKKINSDCKPRFAG
jgi:hypothetical protein